MHIFRKLILHVLTGQVNQVSTFSQPALEIEKLLLLCRAPWLLARLKNTLRTFTCTEKFMAISRLVKQPWENSGGTF